MGEKMKEESGATAEVKSDACMNGNEEKTSAEEKEAVGQMKDGEATTNNQSSLSRSTGPRTPQGKERSKLNAIKQGIFSKVIVLKNEPRAAFDALLNGLFDDLQPQGALEEILVDKLAILVWRYRRLIVAEAKNDKGIDFFDPGGAQSKTDSLLRCESSIERAFDRTLTQLERLRRMRLGQPVPPPIKLEISS